MVAEPIKPRISKMPPKKRHVGQKRMKAGTKHGEQRAKKAASDAAVANGEPNPTPVGRPRKLKRGCRSSWLQPEAFRVLNSAVLSAGEQLRSHPTGQFRVFTQLRPKSTNDTTDCG